MEIKTFRAKTMQQALNLVRSEMGVEATVLHTRELNSSLLGRLMLGRQYEIAATATPRQTAAESAAGVSASGVSAAGASGPSTSPVAQAYTASGTDYRARYRDHFRQQAEQGLDELQELAEQLREQSHQTPGHQVPDTIFQIYTQMIEADIEEPIAQELIERLQQDPEVDLQQPGSAAAQLVAMLAAEITVTGPIQAQAEQGKVVALVGPTGVGKTTTIAKLAANYRLRENKRVGLITVDTYRIAAVEQLRTYAEIIDLPMEIVSTPREMREAIARMSHLDLILMDTAGRSPRDEVKIQELKSMLMEAEPDEVHLVLSAIGGARSLKSTAERFATVGTTALLITKLDEATELGNLISVTRSSGLPLSYLTDGQNVPDDIRIAQPEQLAALVLGGH
jgi:flagellar biosynthesis protein FlhF